MAQDINKDSQVSLLLLYKLNIELTWTSSNIKPQAPNNATVEEIAKITKHKTRISPMFKAQVGKNGHGYLSISLLLQTAM